MKRGRYLLHVVSLVLRGIRVIQKIWAYDQLRRLASWLRRVAGDRRSTFCGRLNRFAAVG
jgi:hypothetical protein